jgi:hypothetical protein
MGYTTEVVFFCTFPQESKRTMPKFIVLLTIYAVRIALLIAALNDDLEVLSVDIQNAYLHAKCQ